MPDERECIKSPDKRHKWKYLEYKVYFCPYCGTEEDDND